MKTKVEIFAQLTEKAAATYEAKNHDYGDSFAKVREKFPNSVLVRLNDKLSRLEVLMGGEVANVKDESIDDTLLDLANYALMELAERIYERQQPNHSFVTTKYFDREPCVQVRHCDYLDCGRCMGQKGMPPCTPGTGYCPVKKR